MRLSRNEAALVRRTRLRLKQWPYLRWLNLAISVALCGFGLYLWSLNLDPQQASTHVLLILLSVGLSTLIATLADWRAESKSLLLRLVENAKLDPDTQDE